MNYIDLIIVILVLISAISGAFKGFIHEVSSLIGLIAGIWCAVKFSGALKTFLVKRWDVTYQYIDVVSFVIIFVAILILIGIASKAIEKTIESAKLSTINRILGLVFSAFKTIFFLGVFFILIENLHKSLPFLPVQSINEAKYAQPIKVISLKTFPYLKNMFDDVDEELSPKQDDKKEKEEVKPDEADSVEIIS